jgi:hypothetical protein
VKLLAILNLKETDYWVSELGPTSSILNTGKPNVSEIGSVSGEVRKTPTLFDPLQRSNFNCPVIAVRNAGGSLPSSLRIPEGGHNSETQ